MTQLSAERGDITLIRVDAIVNAANEALLGGGPGVRCPTGEARVTPGFDLPARLVIHTVGPVWQGGAYGERERLAACYRNVLALCVTHQVRSVSFPAISCGVYRFPVPEACAIAVREIRSAISDATPLDAVRLIAFDAGIYAALNRIIQP
jgi:O-acetyl-ADP-ribose deacetylase (regulator of RNase III)